MIQAHFIFHGDLASFLSALWREQVTNYAFDPHQTVKHLIEAVGIPHTEIGAITANELVIELDYRVQENDVIDVYTIHDSPYPTETCNSQPCRFVLDNHLGKLARYLRMLGFDCIYDNGFQDDTLAEITQETGRILLTRDRRLLMRKAVRSGYCLRSTSSQQQVLEVLRRYHLVQEALPLSRCIRCNDLLQPVKKEDILDRLQPLTRRYFDIFHICPSCGQIYWKGSHQEHMETMITQFLEKARK